MEHFLFYFGLSLLLVHEMDAVRCQEWKMLPGISKLKDNTAYIIFTLAHIPLYLFIFWGLLFSGNFRENLILWLDIFFIVHLILHILFLKNKQNKFTGILSGGIIVVMGITGLADILVYFVR